MGGSQLKLTVDGIRSMPLAACTAGVRSKTAALAGTRSWTSERESGFGKRAPRCVRESVLVAFRRRDAARMRAADAWAWPRSFFTMSNSPPRAPATGATRAPKDGQDVRQSAPCPALRNSFLSTHTLHLLLPFFISPPYEERAERRCAWMPATHPDRHAMTGMQTPLSIRTRGEASPCVHCAPRANPACDRFAQPGPRSPACVEASCVPSDGRSRLRRPRRIPGPGPCLPLLVPFAELRDRKRPSIPWRRLGISPISHGTTRHPSRR